MMNLNDSLVELVRRGIKFTIDVNQQNEFTFVLFATRGLALYPSVSDEYVIQQKSFKSPVDGIKWIIEISKREWPEKFE